MPLLRQLAFVLSVAAAILYSAPHRARAQTAEELYRGKTVGLLISFGDGEAILIGVERSTATPRKVVEQFQCICRPALS